MPNVRGKRGATATVPPPPSVTSRPLLRHAGLSFSFKHFVHRPPFEIADRGGDYLLALVERLRDLAGLSAIELLTGRSKAIRCHPVIWVDTSQPGGFDHLNATVRAQVAPYQFSISANAHGRVHGFFIDDVFYVVWLDPAHQLYPGT